MTLAAGRIYPVRPLSTVSAGVPAAEIPATEIAKEYSLRVVTNADVLSIPLFEDGVAYDEDEIHFYKVYTKEGHD